MNDQVILHFSIILALLMSITAIFIAIKAFQSTSRQYSLNIRPLMSITYAYPKYYRRLSLRNYGMGTAVIRKINFIKDDQVFDEIWRAFPRIPKEFWISDQVFSQDVFLLKPSEEVILGELSAQKIINGQAKLSVIFQKFKSELDGLEIRIHYSNIAGEVQNPFRRVISVGRFQ